MTAFRFRPALQPLEDRLTPALGFATQQIFTVGNGPFGVTTGDLNGDGRADIVTTNDVDGAVSILVNTTPSGTATPTFAAKQDFTVVSGTGPVAVLVADLNGDGRPDIATANNAGGVVAVRLNTTPVSATVLTFAPVQTFAVGAYPVDIKAGDFNGDGRPDLLVSNNGAGAGAGTTVSVLLNTTPTQSGAASFTPQQTFQVGTGPRGVAVGDLNGDGRADIAVANSGNSNISVLLNTTATGAAAASFAPQTAFATGTGMGDVEFGDLNGDGRLDLAVPNNDASSVSVLLNTMAVGAAIPTFADRQDFPVGTNPFALKVGDFDGDGRIDIATANSGTTTVSVLLNRTTPGATTPTFAASQDFTVGTQPLDVALADFNGDGRLDLVASTFNAATGTTVSVLPNTSTGGTVMGPVLVGQFGATGVWAYNRVSGTWITLTGANANALAASASGNVVASFGGNGVWYYRASNQTWKQINGVEAVAVAIDPLGNAYASFAGYGTATYRLATGGWATTTGAVADKLAVGANGDLVGNFGGFGVYRYNPTTNWVSLVTPNADALAIGENGDIAANFGAYGVYRFKAGTWTLINANRATTLAVGANGSVVASFPGFGVAKYIPYANGWQSLGGVPATSVAMDLYGNVFAGFTGYGVYEFNPYFGWRLRRATDAGLLGLG